MTDWHNRRLHERVVYRSVDRKTWEEGSDYTQISGGSISMSAFSDIKVTGSLDFEGQSIPEGDRIRIYYGFMDNDGNSAFLPLATLMFSIPKTKYDGMSVTGTMRCQSVLAIVSAKNYGEAFTITAGTQAVQKAIDLVESLGVRVNNPDPSAYTIANDHTFAARDANYLTIVNWLLDAAGYSSLWVDEYGIAQMTPYVEPLERTVTVELRDDESSILLPEIERERDFQDTPNAVRLSYDTDQVSLSAYALNVDPESALSIQNRGYEITHQETISELDGETSEEMLENLKKKAESMLISKSSDIEYVTGSCLWKEGMVPNAAMLVDYVGANIDWRGALTNIDINLDVGVETDFSARRFVRTDFKTEVGGRIIWEAPPEEE